ncbi:MAG: hypothetical protein NVS4B13_00820 [Candidatus Elarobacter sp.]
MLGIGTATAAPSMAAPTVYGSAQLKYTVNATASISIAVNYDVNGAIQGAVASSILASTAGSCAAGVAEGANATLTFGGITPPAAVGTYTSCLYKNALSIGVNSNDAAGVKVIEYVDAVQAGTVVCAYPLDALPKVKPTQSSATAIAGNGTCAAPTGGAAGTALTGLGAVTAGAGYGAQGNPGAPATNVVAGTPTSTAYTAGGFTLYNTAAAPPVGWNFMGEDVSLSVSPAAASGVQTSVITVALIPT